MDTPIDMVKLGFSVAVYLQAKNKENAAKQERMAAEAAIAELIPGKDVGQQTVPLPDGRKVVVKRSLLYKADLNAIREIFYSYAKEAKRLIGPPIKTKTTSMLDIKGYEWYIKNVPEVHAELAEHVVVTPAKTAVTIKKVSE